MAFTIDTFTSKLTKGGALASLFECDLTSAKGSGMDIADFRFLCNSAVFPSSAIEASSITYMGTVIQIPGNRPAGQLTTAVYNDEDMKIRNHIENWMEKLNGGKNNKRETGFSAINSYTGSLKVKQLAKEGGSITKSYDFIDCWPSAVGEISLSWESNEIQTFDITWEYGYFKSPQSDIGY